MTKQTNVVKIIAFTVVTLIIALIVECIMFTQHGMAISNSSVITTLVTMLVSAVVVVLLAVADWHFSNYATIAVMMYYGIIDLGGLLQVQSKGWGLLVQLLSVIGIVLCVYGIVLGVKQREILMRRKYHDEQRRK